MAYPSAKYDQYMSQDAAILIAVSHRWVIACITHPFACATSNIQHPRVTRSEFQLRNGQLLVECCAINEFMHGIQASAFMLVSG